MSAADALAYVDKALDNVADLDVIWETREVVEMLEDIRSLMLTGEPLPGLFTMRALELEARASVQVDGALW